MTVEIVKTAPETKTATKTAGTTAAKTGASAAAREAAAKKKAAQKKAALKKAAVRKVSRAALQRAKALRAVRIARQQIGDPYRYGATGPGAFDCSGLVQYAWRKAGVRLPRTTWSIKSAVRKKVSWGSFKPGDLIFTSGGGHVGMYVGDGKMVHAPRTGTRVRIDKLDAYRRSSFVGAVRPGA
ncbi:C40 family peptidase [Microbispora sp. H11081]|uniref:C40 family peptidase n=1 Tax=Microbispora sp. H11081 TaxID=2729107 RepID=UPI002899117E|nr:C40 family peptidase [Microbispora sp. H11081]